MLENFIHTDRVSQRLFPIAVIAKHLLLGLFASSLIDFPKASILLSFFILLTFTVYLSVVRPLKKKLLNYFFIFVEALTVLIFFLAVIFVF